MIEQTLERIAVALERISNSTEVIASRVLKEELQTQAMAGTESPDLRPVENPGSLNTPQPAPQPEPIPDPPNAPVPQPEQPAPPQEGVLSLDDTRSRLRKHMADPKVGKFASNIISDKIKEFGVMDLTSLNSKDPSLLSQLVENVKIAMTEKLKEVEANENS